MDLRTHIKYELRKRYGEFETYLENEYERVIVDRIFEESSNCRLSEGVLEIKRAWVTYNQVIIELKNNLKDTLKVKELQYRLTDIEDPNKVCIEVLNSLEKRSPELQRLYEKIMNF